MSTWKPAFTVGREDDGISRMISIYGDNYNPTVGKGRLYAYGMDGCYSSMRENQRKNFIDQVIALAEDWFDREWPTGLPTEQE